MLTNSSDKQTAHPYDEDRVVHYSPGYNKQYETTTMSRYSVRTRISAGRLNSKLSISPIALGVVPRKDEERRQLSIVLEDPILTRYMLIICSNTFLYEGAVDIAWIRVTAVAD